MIGCRLFKIKGHFCGWSFLAFGILCSYQMHEENDGAFKKVDKILSILFWTWKFPQKYFTQTERQTDIKNIE